MYQNGQALAYCGAFLDVFEVQRFEKQIELAREEWLPTQRLSDDAFQSMWQLNKTLRSVYARTPGYLIENFDTHFTPILGWKSYFETHF